jgi:hypothetical protein
LWSPELHQLNADNLLLMLCGLWPSKLANVGSLYPCTAASDAKLRRRTCGVMFRDAILGLHYGTGKRRQTVSGSAVRRIASQ